jgi:adenine-specific DNA methylase
VIAWLWARTVKCPNPACGCQMPLVKLFELSTKKGKEAWDISRDSTRNTFARQAIPMTWDFAEMTLFS